MRRRWFRSERQSVVVAPNAADEDALVREWSMAKSAARREDLTTQLLMGRQRAIYVWCHRQEANPDLAADLAQDVLLRALTALRNPQTQIQSFGPWIFTLTRNHCANHHRARSRRPQTESPTDLDAFATASLGPHQQLELNEERALVRRWMKSHLSSLERTALWMRVVDELPLEQIADLLDLTERDQVRVLLQRARRRLVRGAQLELEAETTGPEEMQA